MKNLLLSLALFCASITSIFAQQTYLEVFGEVETDINRSYDIVRLDDSLFALGGEWNGKGYLMTVNHKGQMVDYLPMDNYLSGTSSIKDLVQDDDGNLIAVGECDHCAANDTLAKIFALKTSPTLDVLYTKTYGSSFAANNTAHGPSVAVRGGQVVVSASQGAYGWNFQDLLVMALTPTLDTLWRKTINSCGNCGFDYPLDLTATSTGYAVLVQNDYTDSLTLYHLATDGSVVWKKRHLFGAPGTGYFKLAYRAGAIYACGTRPVPGADPAHSEGFVLKFAEGNGHLIGGLAIDIPGLNEEILDISFANDGTLLAAHRRGAPNDFGSYLVSRVYRLNPATGAMLDFVEIPNPNDITNMGITGILALNSDGSELAACGIRGFLNRSFFFSVNSLEGTATATADAVRPLDVLVYPNPATGPVFFEIPAENGPAHLEIFTATGQLVQTGLLDKTTATADVSTLENGMYVWRLTSKEGRATGKLMVAR